MLLSSTPLPPNKMDGRAIACGTPRSRRHASTAALPLKYGYGEAASAWVIETCTIRWMPARAAAANRTRLFATAVAWVSPPWGNRTQ